MGIDINNCREQCYDIASIVLGSYAGQYQTYQPNGTVGTLHSAFLKFGGIIRFELLWGDWTVRQICVNFVKLIVKEHMGYSLQKTPYILSWYRYSTIRSY